MADWKRPKWSFRWCLTWAVRMAVGIPVCVAVIIALCTYAATWPNRENRSMWPKLLGGRL